MNIPEKIETYKDPNLYDADSMGGNIRPLIRPSYPVYIKNHISPPSELQWNPSIGGLTPEKFSLIGSVGAHTLKDKVITYLFENNNELYDAVLEQLGAGAVFINRP